MNHRHHDFQSCALPTELPGHRPSPAALAGRRAGTPVTHGELLARVRAWTALGRADTAARVAQLLVGLFLYGISLALLVRAALGVGPWDVLSLGIASHLPMSYGTATIVVSALVLLVWIPLRQPPGDQAVSW